MTQIYGIKEVAYSRDHREKTADITKRIYKTANIPYNRIMLLNAQVMN